MGRRDDYLAALLPWVRSGTGLGELQSFLLAHSNLPGPRGNLELAWAFGDAFEIADVDDALVAQVWAWLRISEQEGPTGDPLEFLPFCALQALAAHHAQVDEGSKRRIVDALCAAASDGRWRIREAVAMGFQRIAERDFDEVVAYFEAWLDRASLVERRAIVASLAHPPVLTNVSRVTRCLAIIDRILHDVQALDGGPRRAEAFRVLKKGLQYAISVFAAAAPDDGFAFIRRWAEEGDPDVQSILLSNLKKARLARKYPEQVASALALIDRAKGDAPTA